MSAALDDRRMDYFQLLDREQQEAAIRRLAASGMSDHGVSAATRLTVEMVRAILGERRPLTP